jgi:hypothetical protein
MYDILCVYFQVFFAEEPELTARRVAMEQRRERLVQASAKLSNITASTANGGGTGSGVYSGNYKGWSVGASQQVCVL